MKATGTAREGREIRAILGACLLVFGVAVAPVAHTAAHAWLPRHTHEGAAIVVEHCHAGACHVHGAPSDPRRPAAQPIHGAHSLLHNGVAVETPLPGAPAVPMAMHDEVRYASFAKGSPARLATRDAQARGPPRASSPRFEPRT